MNKIPQTSSFKRSKLALATGFVIGALGAFSLSTSPMFASLAHAESAKVNTSAAVAGSLPDLTQMIKNNRSAVVSISAKRDGSPRSKRFGGKGNDFDQFKGLPKEFEKFFKNLPQQPHGDQFGKRGNAHGSGFVVSADGYVVTNAHVIDGTQDVTVKLEDKREFKAEVVGVDELSDIALLKIAANDLPAVSLGDSDKLDVGQWVVAIGTPFGLDYTATQGIVSALSRSLPADTYVPFIQTDAAVNPGNSGGPLFDLDGQVVGVNSQIYSRSGGYMGVSFAIPINIVKNVTEQLKENGSVSRGWLGVGIQGIDDNLAQSLGMKNTHGSLITSVVPGSPADKAGLQAGDVITQFDNKAVNAVNELPILVGNTKIGKEVAVSILRAGSDKQLNVTIDKLKSEQDDKVELAALEKGSLGVAVSALSPEEKAKNDDKGVRIQKVLPDSAAASAGLRQGDVILTVAGKNIDSPASLKAAIKTANGDKPLAILLKRGNQAMFVAVKLNI